MKVAQSLDHFVVPVDDLVVAEEFYVRVFGGRITRRNGLNVRQRKRGAVPHTFIQIGGKRMGVYLQSEDRPQPGERPWSTYLLVHYNRARDRGSGARPKRFGRAFRRTGTECSLIRQTDAIFNRSGRQSLCGLYGSKSLAPSSTASGRMTGVGYLELEAPDVAASVDFYEKARLRSAKSQ